MALVSVLNLLCTATAGIKMGIHCRTFFWREFFGVGQQHPLEVLPRYVAEWVEEGAKSHGKRGFQTPYYIQSLTEIPFHGSEGQSRHSVIIRYAEFLGKVVGSSEYAMFAEAYWSAKSIVLQQAADKFVRRVWQQGLCVMASRGIGMRGCFGRTTLTTACGGTSSAVGVTFLRDGVGSVALIGTENDMNGLTHPEFLEAPFPQALEMIEEVISLWPEDREMLAKILQPVRRA